jgi:hypothetical protein
MNADHDYERLRLRAAFRRPTYLIVKITPRGFEVEDALFDELAGRVTKLTLIRKLFEQGAPVCSSPDGIRANDGTLCDECRHPSCQPRLRVHLASDAAVFLLDLPATSAHNLLELEDQVVARGERLLDWIVKLTVAERGHWGEVVFEPLELTPKKDLRNPQP